MIMTMEETVRVKADIEMIEWLITVTLAIRPALEHAGIEVDGQLKQLLDTALLVIMASSMAVGDIKDVMQIND